MNLLKATDIDLLNIKLTCLLNDIEKVIDIKGSVIIYSVDNKKAFATIKDYCNDWNATMPLLVDYGLWLQPPMTGDGYWHVYDSECEVSAKCKSPLRSVVICLIKLLNDKPR